MNDVWLIKLDDETYININEIAAISRGKFTDKTYIWLRGSSNYITTTLTVAEVVQKLEAYNR